MIMAIANQKGGTGKTTTTLNLGASLARFHKKKVLLVDLDPQGSLSLYTGFRPEELGTHLGTALRDPGRLDDALQPYFNRLLHVLPASPELQHASEPGAADKNAFDRLADVLREARRRFDYVIVDCPPTLGRLAHLALGAADSLIIPLQCEYMALRGVQLILENVDRARQDANPNLAVLGVLLTMYDARTLHAREVRQEIAEALEGRAPLFSSVIPRTIRFPESAVAMVPMFAYDEEGAAARAYQSLAREVIDHG